LDLPALTVIGLAIGIRLALIAQGWPEMNSDEAVNGLMALHIAQGKDLPIFIYGQSYVGALEAYVAGLLFAIFGASDVLLRLSVVVFSGMFLTILYLLARLLYDRMVGLVAVALLSGGSLEMLFRQLSASGP